MPRLAAPTLLSVRRHSVCGVPAAALDLPAGADAPPARRPAWWWPSPALTDAGQGGGASWRPPPRSKSKRSDADKAPRPFWATVNICDTAKSPNALGVRTSVPGNGSNERIFARYTAQWWSGAERSGSLVAGSGVTDWIKLGRADMSSRQAGWTFRFVQPPPARPTSCAAWSSFSGATRMRARGAGSGRPAAGTLRRSRPRRGARRSQRAAVVRERTLLTKTGMKGVQGGDPAGLSKAMCLIW